VLDEEQVLEAPAPLSSAHANDADALTALFGEYVARCVYSPIWQHRAAATRFMAREAEEGRVPDARVLVRYLVKALKDKVAAVVTDASRLLTTLVAHGGRAVPAVVHAAFPQLLERLADGNSRIAVRSRATLAGCASMRAAEPAQRAGGDEGGHRNAGGASARGDGGAAAADAAATEKLGTLEAAASAPRTAGADPARRARRQGKGSCLCETPWRCLALPPAMPTAQCVQPPFAASHSPSLRRCAPACLLRRDAQPAASR
jgi:hypothetical protein